MSINYSAYLAVGFHIPYEDFCKVFIRKTREEVSHMEDRFDPKTGAKLEPIKVVDEEAVKVIVFNGQNYDPDEMYELTDALAAYLKCDIDTDGSSNGDQDYVFTPKYTTDSFYGHDYGRLTVGGALTYKQVVKLGPVLDALRLKLIKLGLKPGKAVVMVGSSES